MASLLAPFSGFIPTVDYAHRIVGPPSAMLSSEQKKAAREDDLTFRNALGRGAQADHAAATQWFARCRELGALRPVESSVLVHRLTRGDFSATGLIADVSLAAYDAGRVKRHETTIAKTERKMIDYMQSTRVFGNPVALTHEVQPDIAALLASHSDRTADVAFESIDGTHHSLWIVGGDHALELCASFSDVLYITDGHHRLAAASSLAAEEGREDPHVPAGLFAEDQLRIWAFARAIRDGNVVGADLLGALDQAFGLEPSTLDVPRPTSPRQIGVRVDGKSFMLTVPDSHLPTESYDQLDVNLLQNLVLEPFLGVTDPRTDPRLHFIADTGDHAHEPDSYDAWFLPHATSVRDVMMVADAGLAMPPKSTFFLPKLPSGFVVRPIDTAPGV